MKFHLHYHLHLCKLPRNLINGFDFVHTDFKFLWIVRLSWNESSKFQGCRSSIQRASAFKWSFNLLSFEGFLTRGCDIIMIAFTTILFRGKSSVQARTVFRTLSNMQGGACCENSQQLLVFNYFRKTQNGELGL